MASDYEIAKLLYMKAGWLKNQGVRNTVETSMAKQFATDASFHAASEAIAVHGSYGYSDEFPVERFLRNARGAMIYEGTNEIHSLIQAGYALKNRTDKALRREMPAYEPQRWQAEGARIREAT
jgi:alkylation response protein AidB-like acyl-CoA dehydrogenase